MEESLTELGARRIAVIHNVDFKARSAQTETDGLLSFEADAEVAQTARIISSILKGKGSETVILEVDDSVEQVVPQLRDLRIDAVFNLVETLGGDPSREAELPMRLEAAGIPYTGNSSAALALAHAKDRARKLLLAYGLPTPAGLAVNDARELPADLAARVAFPLFVKPARTDASIGIDQGSIVADRDALARRVAWLTQRVSGPALVEEYLPGPEVNVAIFPNPFDGQTAVTQMDFSGFPADLHPIVSYNCKWFPDSPEYVAVSKPCADRYPPAMMRKIVRLARAAFLVIGGTGYGRVDMRFNTAGQPMIIDINPNNDLDPTAGLAIAARSVGLEYDVLLLKIVRDALRKARHVSAPHSSGRS